MKSVPDELYVVVSDEDASRGGHERIEIVRDANHAEQLLSRAVATGHCIQMLMYDSQVTLETSYDHQPVLAIGVWQERCIVEYLNWAGEDGSWSCTAIRGTSEEIVEFCTGQGLEDWPAKNLLPIAEAVGIVGCLLEGGVEALSLGDPALWKCSNSAGE